MPISCSGCHRTFVRQSDHGKHERKCAPVRAALYETEKRLGLGKRRRSRRSRSPHNAKRSKLDKGSAAPRNAVLAVEMPESSTTGRLRGEPISEPYVDAAGHTDGSLPNLPRDLPHVEGLNVSTGEMATDRGMPKKRLAPKLRQDVLPDGPAPLPSPIQPPIEEIDDTGIVGPRQLAVRRTPSGKI